MKTFDLTNRRFGKLTAIRPQRTNTGLYGWLCRCDCGKEAVVRTTALTSGHTKSCGCYAKHLRENGVPHTTHGNKHSRLYRIWCGMKSRCCNPNVPFYKYYGGKGIAVCEEWQNDFQSFFGWSMTNGYSDGLTIDRINGDGDYSPENCRWVTMTVQNRNKKKVNRCLKESPNH